ncbi:hypothetical protein FIBSPDRAFT_455407 [Athelia psychrophila]|uniref:DNA mismatch repair protein MutS core domain-containing protein n=1 Tax=Athelia psychrophila TaxID=1759441 RepID=A0A166LX04_9AGAM|nr:hypothetical protein FIBSPDRAFT_455407 [Fibularhizoctonia sp. CBS 109695]
MRFSAHSLLIRYVPIESTMMVDSETACNLKLVETMARKQSTHPPIGTIGHSFTAIGARLLRVNVLAPITVVAAIDARLDAGERNSRLSSCEGPRHVIDSITKPVKSEDLFNEVREAPRAHHNMDFGNSSLRWVRLRAYALNN